MKQKPQFVFIDDDGMEIACKIASTSDGQTILVPDNDLIVMSWDDVLDLFYQEVETHIESPSVSAYSVRRMLGNAYVRDVTDEHVETCRDFLETIRLERLEEEFQDYEWRDRAEFTHQEVKELLASMLT